MDPWIAATVFVVVFPAELPDKTFVASLVLGTRLRPLAAWIGIAAAFAVQTTIAVAAGGILSLLPHRLVQAVVAVLFAIGAIVIFRASIESEEDAVDAEARAAATSHQRAALTAFVVVFFAEWGDITQILTGTLAAKYHDPISVFVGALLALWAVGALGVVGGRSLLRVMPLRTIHRIAGTLFALLALVSAIEAIRG